MIQMDQSVCGVRYKLVIFAIMIDVDVLNINMDNLDKNIEIDRETETHNS